MERSRKACIVGIGQSEYTKWGGIKDRSEFQLSGEAIIQAAGDAGLDPREIDGLASFSDDSSLGPLMQVALGIPNLRWTSMVWGGGGGGTEGALTQACAAVEAGYADIVAVYRGLCQGQSRRFGLVSPTRTHASFVNPFGLFAPAQMLALLVRRYMHKYGVGPEALAEIALNARANANRNPAAIMYDKPLTEEQYYASRWIAEPLRLYDCCLETDGACAVLVTTTERARDLKQPVVQVAATAFGSGPQWSTGPLGSHNMPDDDYASTNGKPIAKELYRQSGLTPKDVDVAQIYDHFSGMVLMGLEDYGFCGAGEAGDFVKDGNIRWGSGSLPINTAGGQLSEAYVHGMNHLAEAVRQMRGTSTSQVEGAEICLVTGGLGTSPTSAAILARM